MPLRHDLYEILSRIEKDEGVASIERRALEKIIAGQLRNPDLTVGDLSTTFMHDCATSPLGVCVYHRLIPVCFHCGLNKER